VIQPADNLLLPVPAAAPVGYAQVKIRSKVNGLAWR
jgi:hypothetical protein